MLLSYLTINSLSSDVENIMVKMFNEIKFTVIVVVINKKTNIHCSDKISYTKTTNY